MLSEESHEAVKNAYPYGSWKRLFELANPQDDLNQPHKFWQDCKSKLSLEGNQI